jgi:hypothetical protein
MTIQAYNVLNIVDLIKYCSREGIRFQHHLLQYPPYLSTAVLPQIIRDIAAERLLSFLKRGTNPGGTFSAVSVAELAAAISAQPAVEDDHLLRDFMLFTNDMDLSRGQNLATAIPELCVLLDTAGANWIAEKRFAS